MVAESGALIGPESHREGFIRFQAILSGNLKPWGGAAQNVSTTWQEKFGRR